MNAIMQRAGVGAIVAGVGAWLCFASGSFAWAEGSQPGSKSTCSVSAINLLSGPSVAGAATGEWTTVLRNRIRTSSQKDLFVDVSLECGLYTDTLVRSKGGTKDTSTAGSSIEVRVLLDGAVQAYPGDVVFARRNQELSATLQGLIDGALSVDPLTGAVVIDESQLQPEEIQLVLDTMGAHAFNFLLSDVGVGTHTVEVQARITLTESAQQGDAVARATIGKGLMTVDEVRLIVNEDFAF